MSNFQKYISVEQRVYPSIDLTAVPGYVYDFGTLPVPGDGRWQSDAGPATGVFDNAIVPAVGNVVSRSGGYIYTTSGPPNTGNFAPPMLAYDLAGNTYGCVGSGNPGTWQQLIASAQSGTFAPLPTLRQAAALARYPVEQRLGETLSAAPPTITVEGNAVSTGFITSPQTWSVPAVAGDLVTYGTSSGAPAGGSSPQIRIKSAAPYTYTSLSRLYVGNNLSAGGVTAAGAWQFSLIHTGQKIAFWFRNAGWLRFKIDGAYVSLDPTYTPSSWTGYVLLDFSAYGNAARLIEVETFLCDLAFIQMGPLDTVTAPPRHRNPSIYWVGDSYSYGSNGNLGYFSSMVRTASKRLGVDETFVDAAGGTGYLKVNGSAPNFLTRLQANLPLLVAAGRAPEMVVVAGSINDSGFTSGQMQTQAGLVWDYILSQFPNTQIVAPFFSNVQPTPAALTTVLTGLQAAAATRPQVHLLDLSNVLTGTGLAVLPTPKPLTATPATTGGTLAAGTNYYKLVARNSGQVTLPSVEITAVTTGSTGSVTLTFNAAAGSSGTDIYWGTSSGGQSQLVGSSVGGNVFVHTSPTQGSAGTPPASNTTGALTGSGNSDILRSFDGSHPTQLGHDVYGQLIALGILAQLSAYQA